MIDWQPCSVFVHGIHGLSYGVTGPGVVIMFELVELVVSGLVFLDFGRVIWVVDFLESEC